MFRARIVTDKTPQNPREFKSFGQMVCFHTKYQLGDKHSFSDKDAFLFYLLYKKEGNGERAETVYKKIGCKIPKETKNRDKAIDNAIIAYLSDTFVIVPLYLYDHSGITMNTTGFICGWDSGQVGWIYANKDSVISEFSVFSAQAIEKAKTLLKIEVEIYDKYLCGDVYGYEVLNTKNEIVDSLYGIFGEKEARSILKQDFPDVALIGGFSLA